MLEDVGEVVVGAAVLEDALVPQTVRTESADSDQEDHEKSHNQAEVDYHQKGLEFGVVHVVQVWNLLGEFSFVFEYTAILVLAFEFLYASDEIEKP